MKFVTAITPVFVVLISGLLFSVTWAQESTDKLPIPDEAAQKEASTLIKEVYKADYDKAKNTEQKLALAKKLLKDAIATKDDPVGRFEMLRIAKNIASQQGDLETAFLTISEIVKRYDANEIELQVSALTDASKVARQIKEHEQLIQRALQVLDSATAADRYDLAKEAGGVAVLSARTARAFFKQVEARSKEVEEIERAFVATKTSFDVLKTKPTDPAANLTTGKFLCFLKNDWEAGIPLLALGDDIKLRELSASELVDTPDALVLGDGWWAVSESKDGISKIRIQSHAADWYREALPGLTGLGKAKVIKRLSDAGPTSGKTTARKHIAKTTGSADVGDKISSISDTPKSRDLRSRWLDESYNSIVHHVKDKQWEAIDSKSKKVLWHLTEKARTPEYVELFLIEREQLIRYSSKRSELNKGGKWEWLSNGHWEASKEESSSTENEAATKNDLSRWLNESYDTVIYRVKDKDWVEMDNKTRKIKWHFTEKARTAEHVELFNETRKETVRLSAKRADFLKGGKWEWISNGRWESSKK